MTFMLSCSPAAMTMGFSASGCKAKEGLGGTEGVVMVADHDDGEGYHKVEWPIMAAGCEVRFGGGKN